MYRSHWHLIILIIFVLVKYLHGQEQSNNQECDNCCTYLGSKFVLNFSNRENDFPDAKMDCRKKRGFLLTEHLYDNMADCILRYVKNTHGTIWLDGIDYGDFQSTFNSKGSKNAGNKDMDKHFYICVNQEINNTSLLIVKTSSNQTVDLLSPYWKDKEVFSHVSVYQTITLICEVKRIPPPQLVLHINGSEINKNITRTDTSLSYTTLAGSCGSLGRFTCFDKANPARLNRSIEIIVSCNNEKLFSDNTTELKKCKQTWDRSNDAKFRTQFYDLSPQVDNVSGTFLTKLNGSCSLIGTYLCETILKNGTKSSRTIDVVSDNCSPQPCPGEGTVQTVPVIIGIKSTFSFCVIAYPNISNFLIFNNSVVYKNSDMNYDWDYRENQFFSWYNVSVTVNDVTSYGDLTVGVSTSQGTRYLLNYTVKLEMLPDNNGNSAKLDKTGAGHANISEIIIPVVIITVAVVLAVCCLVCVGCGIFLYRKRERLIKTLSKSLNAVDGSIYNGSSKTDSVELRSSVSVYANVKRGPRRVFERDYTIARPMSDTGRAYPSNRQDNGQELYSTVNTVNVYTNMKSILQSKSTNDLEKLYEESSLVENQYRNVGHAEADPFISNSSSGARSSNSELESGRYISDGLLYIKLEHAENGRSQKPKKARSEEKVDYVKIDFDKTGKLYKKKHKRSRRKIREV